MKLKRGGVLLVLVACCVEAQPLQHVPPATAAQLRDGARVFVGRCLGCHGARQLRGHDLAALGLDESALLAASRDPAAVLKPALSASQALAAFGSVPPDLSLIAASLRSARGSGADFIYTMLRSYRPAPERPGGWDNQLLPGLAMPNPFPPGADDDSRYDAEMAEVAAFLQWMADPGREQRHRLLGPVLGFLLIFAGLAYRLRAAVWNGSA